MTTIAAPPPRERSPKAPLPVAKGSRRPSSIVPPTASRIGDDRRREGQQSCHRPGREDGERGTPLTPATRPALTRQVSMSAVTTRAVVHGRQPQRRVHRRDRERELEEWRRRRRGEDVKKKAADGPKPEVDAAESTANVQKKSKSRRNNRNKSDARTPQDSKENVWHRLHGTPTAASIGQRIEHHNSRVGGKEEPKGRGKSAAAGGGINGRERRSVSRRALRQRRGIENLVGEAEAEKAGQRNDDGEALAGIAAEAEIDRILEDKEENRIAAATAATRSSAGTEDKPLELLLRRFVEDDISPIKVLRTGGEEHIAATEPGSGRKYGGSSGLMRDYDPCDREDGEGEEPPAKAPMTPMVVAVPQDSPPAQHDLLSPPYLPPSPQPSPSDADISSSYASASASAGAASSSSSSAVTWCESQHGTFPSATGVSGTSNQQQTAAAHGGGGGGFLGITSPQPTTASAGMRKQLVFMSPDQLYSGRGGGDGDGGALAGLVGITPPTSYGRRVGWSREDEGESDEDDDEIDEYADVDETDESSAVSPPSVLRIGPGCPSELSLTVSSLKDDTLSSSSAYNTSSLGVSAEHGEESIEI